MKIAVIGGSFDPIHLGHVAMARHVLRHHLADQVWFMVTQITPLKDRQLTSFDTRVALIKKAIAYDKRMRVCTIEQERNGPSYTIDTVRECKRRWPMHSFVWMIGNDQAKQLSAWKDIDALSKEIEFYVFPRHHETITCAYPHQKMSMALMDVSSSELRTGHKLWYLPKAVRMTIANQYLYVESYAKAHMSECRFQHSQSVAQLCVTLAKCHNVDPDKAYCAGILHDICKEWGRDRLHTYLASLDPACLQEPAAIWHGYAGAYYVAQAFYIHDRVITQAIYHHVKGSLCHALAMIVYIADKLDPSRGYDSSATIQVCMKDLRLGYETVKQQQNEYLKKEKTIINE